jgi:nucleoside-diphosphate-sugar epimerase
VSGRVLVAGATGVVGRHLIPRLLADGWAVDALVRLAEDSERLPGGARPIVADLLDPSVARATKGSAAVIHAASAIPNDRAAPKEAWKTNDRIRREGTRHLLAGAEEHGALFVLQSVTMIYAPAGSDWIDATNARIAPGENLVSMLDAERLVRASSVRSLILRQGLLFGADAGASAALLTSVGARALPKISDLDCWQSLLHPDDFADAVRAALRMELTGIYDVVSDLATTSQLVATAASLLAANPPAEMTFAEARQRLDPGLYSAWYSSRRVSAQRLADQGVIPTHTWADMLKQAYDRHTNPG